MANRLTRKTVAQTTLTLIPALLAGARGIADGARTRNGIFCLHQTTSG